MSAATTEQRRFATLLAPATVIVVAGLVLPLLLMARYSLNRFEPGQFMVEALTFGNYVKIISDPYYRRIAVTTVTMAFTATAICLVVGFPVASAIARAPARWKTALLLLVILPLFVGNAVRAAGWMVALGQKGLLNWILLRLGIVSEPAAFMYTWGAVCAGIVSVNLPYVVLTLQSVLEGTEKSAVDAAQSLGATPFTTWRLVTLPLAMPGVVAAGLLSFILAMNAYATPVLLGGPTFQMMAPSVADQVLQQSNWPLGAALAFTLTAITLILTATVSFTLARTHAGA
ncbi:ABC transporter permease [Methylobacterium terricola]|uniref:ABC transporter permease n=1 Tax=Methylobacterium terricola TaxID=2583531 RepID=A0A5C4LB25_9HYPH|nr:ABC transporter permease [Methylobacterium terricola]TNC08338.1 ABC transporter permease [Methylobacterium terricola]